MAVCQLFLRNEYPSVLWGPHQWAGWGGGGEMRTRRRRREFCAQDGISPNAKWFGGPSVLQEAEERTLCKGCRNPGRLLRGRAASAGPWETISLDLGAGFLPGETTGRKPEAAMNKHGTFCGASDETLFQTDGCWKAV